MNTNWNLPEWNQRVYLRDGRLYFQRWLLDFYFFSIRLHKFSESDDDRAHHDHPWWFVTMILTSGYFNVTKDNDGAENREWIKPGSIRLRSTGHTHIVILRDDKPPTWTIVITGRYRHRWGFYVKNKIGGNRFVNSKRYFFENGHH